MKIFNTLTRQKQELKPIEEGKVKIYALSDDEFYKSTCEVRVK